MIKNLVLGGANTTFEGAIYAASREIEFTGGSAAGSDCLHIVARKVTFTGNTVIDNDPAACAALGLDPIDQIRIRLGG